MRNCVAAIVIFTALSPFAQRTDADTIIISTTTTINDGDTSLHNHDVIVRGATLIINGEHPLNSLTIERNVSNIPGVLTHTPGFTNGVVNGVSLLVAEDVFIQGADGKLLGSAININGCGFAANHGPGTGGSAGPSSGGGGAGHGGAGGNGGNVNGVGGGTYGSFEFPTAFGSGGGTGAAVAGGAGGGAVRLTVGGALTLDGIILANGLSTVTGSGGGGAGGSVLIECGPFGGVGSITANGGSGNVTGGEGAGGRIAVHCAYIWSGIPCNAYGGNGDRTGAAGTFFFYNDNVRNSQLFIDNGDRPFVQAITEMSGEVQIPGRLEIRNGGRLGPPVGDSSLHLVVADLAFVDTDGYLYADGRGHMAGQGLGAGGSVGGSTGGGGAGHGGAGGNGSNVNGVGGGTYGSFATPNAFGSGGGTGANVVGGPGGGVIRLSCLTFLLIDGVISANGASTTTGSGGGGAGGSIWIDTNSLGGTGLITANGGSGNSSGGEGAGGRVALYSQFNSLTFDVANLRALGGTGERTGAAGTVYYKRSTSLPAELIVDNGAQPFVQAITEMSGEVTVPENLVVRNGGRVGPPVNNSTLHLIVQGDATVAADGTIEANGRGFGPGTGPGAGGSAGASTGGGGAGHGGAGGNGSNVNGVGGPTYGSFTDPMALGSGGGTGASVAGGAGGGAFRLSVNGNLTVDGVISVNGGSTITGSAGGGSGGSLVVNCGNLLGTGVISANGGSGNSSGGEGGGGRVAVFADNSTFDDTNIRAHGGAGDRVGGAGTVQYKPSTASPEVLIIDNGDQAFVQAITEMTGELAVPENLLVRNNGHLGPPNGIDTLVLTVQGNAVIASDGHIEANGRGFLPNQGPGAGGSAGASSGGGGAGHGGAGGNGINVNGVGGPTYGSPTFPITLGSGGGTGASALGGAGGGAIRINVIGELTVDGVLAADGVTTSTGSGGGGSGGSVWIDCETLSGAGTISANGGTGNSSGGEGGGGRVAVYSCNVLMSPAQIMTLPGAGLQIAQPGTVFFLANSIELIEHPRGQIFTEGETIVLDVVAEGTDLEYQWRRDGMLLNDDAHYSGSHSATLTITNAQCDPHAGDYDAIVTDGCGFVASDVAVIDANFPADVNGDCHVNVADLLAVINSWGACPGGCPPSCNSDIAPVGGDCQVNVSDLLMVINNWG